MLQRIAVGVEIGDRAGRHATVHGGLGHRRRDLCDQARIKRTRNQILGAERHDLFAIRHGHHIRLFGLRQRSDRVHGGHFHCGVDGGRADIEGTAEDERKAQYIVDLVRIIRTAGCHHHIGVRLSGQFGEDLRFRVGQRQDQWPLRHGLDHFGCQHLAGGQAEKDIGAGNDFGQRARLGLNRELFLVRIHQDFASFVDHALDVGDDDVLFDQAELAQQVETGQCRGTGARDHQFDLGNILADDLQSVNEGRADSDRSAVLVVVEDRDAATFAQLTLHDEALGGFDIFQIDAAKGWLQTGDDVDQFVGVALVDFDVEHIDTGEFLEQYRLAFHHRLGRQRTDGAESQYCRAVGDHRHEVAARSQIACFSGVGNDRFTSRGNPRGICQREVALIQQCFGRRD